MEHMTLMALIAHTMHCTCHNTSFVRALHFHAENQSECPFFSTPFHLLVSIDRKYSSYENLMRNASKSKLIFRLPLNSLNTSSSINWPAIEILFCSISKKKKKTKFYSKQSSIWKVCSQNRYSGVVCKCAEMHASLEAIAI